MWDDNFAHEIFNSLTPIDKSTFNQCFKAYSNQKPYFVKKIKQRPYETLEEAVLRINKGEKTNDYFNKNGINTVVAACQNGEYTHCFDGDVYVAYPWIDASIIQNRDLSVCFQIGMLLGKMHNIAQKENLQIDCSKYKKIPIKKITTDIIKTARVYNWDSEIMDVVERINTCCDYLQEIAPISKLIISHGDLNDTNILQLDGRLWIVDWELSGVINATTELFDVALSWCDFCSINTKVDCFEEVIRGYSDKCILGISITDIELAITELFWAITNAWIDHFIQYVNSGNCAELDSAINYYDQFCELNKYKNTFKKIMYKYI